MIVDADPELQGRVAEVQAEVDADFGMQPYIFDEGMRRDILEMPALKPGDEWRINVKGSDPMSLLYTRYALIKPGAEQLLTCYKWYDWSSEGMRFQRRQNVPGMLRGKSPGTVCLLVRSLLTIV